MSNATELYVFAGPKLMAKGSAQQLLSQNKSQLNQAGSEPILFFDSTTGRQVDLDLSTAGLTSKAIEAQADDNANRAPQKSRGRPKLGVVGREVTLLPRHWEWLDQQRGGASAALRRLIDECRKERAGEDAIREAQDSANRFMMAMAGDLPGFEEAVRALYARDGARFREEIRRWPADIRNCASEYAEAAFT